MSKRKSASARIASEFGTANLEDMFDSDPQRGFERGHDADMTRRQAHEELSRRIARGELQPLNGRAPIEHDWMDWEGSEEWHGAKRKGPTLAEQNELHREYGAEIDRLMSRPSAGMQDRAAEDQMPATAEELAEQLHREFVSAYKDLAGDASAIERVARSEIETHGFSFADRHTLYERIANRLRAEGRHG